MHKPQHTTCCTTCQHALVSIAIFLHTMRAPGKAMCFNIKDSTHFDCLLLALLFHLRLFSPLEGGCSKSKKWLALGKPLCYPLEDLSKRSLNSNFQKNWAGRSINSSHFVKTTSYFLNFTKRTYMVRLHCGFLQKNPKDLNQKRLLAIF